MISKGIVIQKGVDTDGNGVESHGGWMKEEGFRWSLLIVCLELTSSISPCMEYFHRLPLAQAYQSVPFWTKAHEYQEAEKKENRNPPWNDHWLPYGRHWSASVEGMVL